MAKSVGIIAYGTRKDRQKLEALAALNGESGSSWLVKRIRSEFASVFGPAQDEVDRGTEDAESEQG